MQRQEWWRRGGMAYRAILANASSLVGATAVTSALGFVYWWVAARQFPPEAVGFTSATIAAMTLLGTLGMMGLGTLLIGVLPQHPGAEASLISTAAAVTAITGGVLGAAFAFLAPWLSADFRPLGANAGTVALFALGVALTALTLMLDQALIGMMRGGLQLGRNLVFAVAKLVALVAVAFSVARAFDLAMFTTWVLGMLLSLALPIGFGLTRRAPLGRYRPQWTLLRSFGRAALGHHGLNLALQFSSLALPLVVTVTLSATVNAYFYTAWMIAGFVFTLPFALTVVLYAVGAADPVALARKIRFTLGLAAAAGVAANIVLLVGAGFVLQFFGPVYAAEASGPLRVLTLGVFALIVKDHYVAVCRIQNRVLPGATRIMLASCLELVGAAVGAYYGGLTGLTVGWLIAVCIEALLMARAVLRVTAPYGLRHWRLPAPDTTMEAAEREDALSPSLRAGHAPVPPAPLPHG